MRWVNRCRSAPCPGAFGALGHPNRISR